MLLDEMETPQKNNAFISEYNIVTVKTFHKQLLISSRYMK